MNTPDVFVKDEGYASFRFCTDSAKEVAHKLKIPNSLADFDEFCGNPVWKPESPVGLFQAGFPIGTARRLIKELRKRGLTVETEI
jgi:hypothetical protein